MEIDQKNQNNNNFEDAMDLFEIEIKLGKLLNLMQKIFPNCLLYTI